MAEIRSINQTIDEVIPSVQDVVDYVKQTADEIRNNVEEYDGYQDDRLRGLEGKAEGMANAISTLEKRADCVDQKETIGLYPTLGAVPKIITDDPQPDSDPIVLKSHLDGELEEDRERLDTIEGKEVKAEGDVDTTLLDNDEALATWPAVTEYVDDENAKDRERLKILEDEHGEKLEDHEERITELEEDVVRKSDIDQDVDGVKTFLKTPIIPEQSTAVLFDGKAEEDRAATPAEVANTFLESFPHKDSNDAEIWRDEVVNSIKGEEITDYSHPYNGSKVGVFFDVKARNVIQKTNHENDFAIVSKTLAVNVEKDVDTYSSLKKNPADANAYKGYDQINLDIATAKMWNNASEFRDGTQLLTDFEIPTAALVQKMYVDLHTNYVRKTPSMDPAQFQFEASPIMDPVTGQLNWTYSLRPSNLPEDNDIDETIYGTKIFKVHPIVPTKEVLPPEPSTTIYATEMQVYMAVSTIFENLFNNNQTITGIWKFENGLTTLRINDSEGHNVYKVTPNDHGGTASIAVYGNESDIIRFNSHVPDGGRNVQIDLYEVDAGGNKTFLKSEEISYKSQVEEEVNRLDNKIDTLETKVDEEVKRLDDLIGDLDENKVDKDFCDDTDGYVIGDITIAPSGVNEATIHKTAVSVRGDPTQEYDAIVRTSGGLEMGFDNSNPAAPVLELDASKLIPKSIADITEPGYPTHNIMGDLWVNKSGDDIRFDKFRINVDTGAYSKQDAIISATGGIGFDFSKSISADQPRIAIDGSALVPKDIFDSDEIVESVEISSSPNSARVSVKSVDVTDGSSVTKDTVIEGKGSVAVYYTPAVSTDPAKIMIDGSSAIDIDRIPAILDGRRQVMTNMNPLTVGDKEMGIVFDYADLRRPEDGGIGDYSFTSSLKLGRGLDFVSVTPEEISITVDESEFQNVLHLDNNGSLDPETITAVKVFTVHPMVPFKNTFPGAGLATEYATERQLVDMDLNVVHKQWNEEISGSKTFHDPIYVSKVVDNLNGHSHDILIVGHPTGGIYTFDVGNSEDVLTLKSALDIGDDGEETLPTETDPNPTIGVSIGDGTHLKVATPSGVRRLAYLDEVELKVRMVQKLGTWNSEHQYPSAKAVWERIEEVRTLALRYEGMVKYFATATSNIEDMTAGDAAIIQPNSSTPPTYTQYDGTDWGNVPVEFENGAVYLVKHITTKQAGEAKPGVPGLTQSSAPSGMIVYEKKESDPHGVFHEVEDDFRSPDHETITVETGNLTIAESYRDAIEDAVRREDVAISGNLRRQVVTALLPALDTSGSLDIHMFSSDVGRKEWDDGTSVSDGSTLPRHIQETVSIEPVGGVKFGADTSDPTKFTIDTSAHVLKDDVQVSLIGKGTAAPGRRHVVTDVAPAVDAGGNVSISMHTSGINGVGVGGDNDHEFVFEILAGWNVEFVQTSAQQITLNTEFKWVTPVEADWE